MAERILTYNNSIGRITPRKQTENASFKRNMPASFSPGWPKKNLKAFENQPKPATRKDSANNPFLGGN